MNTPKPILVSTITPSFKMKRYLKKFLEDLPKQTMFEQLEVVLDHNEPDEEEIGWVKSFQEQYPGRIKHIIVPKVEPIGTSMNRCIRESTGKYVTIWNVDDLRTPNSIELQYLLLENDSTIGVAYGNFRIVRSFGATDGSLVDCSNIPESEFTRSMVIGPFFMFKKILCESAGYFDEQLKSGADFDLAIRLAFHTKAAMPNGLLGYYLNEGLGASTRPNSKQVLDQTTIYLRYGIYDKIDYDIVSKSVIEHSIPMMLEWGHWVSIEKYVPNYTTLLESRRLLYFNKGIRRYVFQRIFFIKRIKRTLKPIVKKILFKK